VSIPVSAKPAVLQRLKQPDYSISEGEAPISPGDARWHSMYASKLRGGLKEIRKGDRQLCNGCYFSSVMSSWQYSIWSQTIWKIYIT